MIRITLGNLFKTFKLSSTWSKIMISNMKKEIKLLETKKITHQLQPQNNL